MAGAPTPSIASLATEVVALDRAEQLDERAQVSLGDSFARMLPPDLVTLFTRRTATVPLRIHRL